MAPLAVPHQSRSRTLAHSANIIIVKHKLSLTRPNKLKIFFYYLLGPIGHYRLNLTSNIFLIPQIKIKNLVMDGKKSLKASLILILSLVFIIIIIINMDVWTNLRISRLILQALKLMTI